MAIITKDIGSAGDPVNGFCTYQIDYDDAKLLLTALRCINNSNAAAWGQAVLVSNGRAYAMRFPSNTTTYIAIPNGQAQQLPITITPNGRVDGVEYHFMWPYP